MADAQAEEFKYFGMDLEFLLRRTPKWMAALEAILFREGGIVEQALPVLTWAWAVPVCCSRQIVRG
jgi:hypothetical protein